MTTSYMSSAMAALLLGASGLAAALDGALDTSFGVAGQQAFAPDGEQMHEIRFNAAATLPDGSILLAGYRHKRRAAQPYEPDYRVAVAKLRADGSPDPAFGSDPQFPGLIIYDDFSPTSRIEEVRAIALTPDGGAILAGHIEAGPERAGFTMKISTDGTLWEGYGEHGLARMASSFFDDVAVDSQGRIVLAGQQRGLQPLYRGFVARLDAAGAPDRSFAGDGVFEFIEMDNGHPVDRFGGMRSVAIAPEDSIVAGGWQARNAYVNAFSLARLKSDGSLDDSFASGGWSISEPQWIDSIDSSYATLELLRDGRIVAAGDYMDADGNYARPFLARFSAQGRADESFGNAATPGYALLQPRAGFAWQRTSGLAVQNDGRLVYTATANDFSPASPGPALFLAGRANADGSPDTSFGDDGVALISTGAPNLFSDATALTLQAGRAVIVGSSGFPAAGTPPLMVRGVASRLQADAIFADGAGD
jgi:uncharacterized delta-60 repeat protein